MLVVDAFVTVGVL